MAKLKKRPVVPIYAIAVVWVIFTLIHPLYRVSDYVSAILLSAVAFIVAKGIWPTVEYELPDPEPPEEAPKDEPREEPVEEAPEAEAEEPKETEDPKEAEEPTSTGDPKLDALIHEKDRAISEMRRLNDAIADETISAQIDQLEDTTSKILDHVIHHPEKQPQIRKFLIYYLPTTLKLLNTYDRMGATGVSGENIDGTMAKIEAMMDTIVSSFHKQLDALFQDEAMDIASDITVMENLLVQEGLADMD